LVALGNQATPDTKYLVPLVSQATHRGR